MDKPIKPIGDFEEGPPIRNYLVAAVAVGAISAPLCFTFAPGLLMSLVPSGEGGSLASIAFLITAFTVLGFTVTPIAARLSPELDVGSRKAITEFLNEHHSGWSIPGQRDGSAQA